MCYVRPGQFWVRHIKSGYLIIRWDLEHEIWGGGRELEPQKPRVPVTYMEKSTKTDGGKI